MEEREELMVSLNPTKTHDPTRKSGLFLKPTSTFTKLGKPLYPNHYCEKKNRSLSVSFSGWRTQQRCGKWKEWVDSMHALHKSTWKKAGIYEAVLNSCYEIKKDDNLILGFVQKWCDETKSFVFSWGEVTVTLEDMMVIGGYSVLGDSVDCAIVNEDLVKVLEKLNEARTELSRSTRRRADPFGWMKKFKDSGSDIEHEAFLISWLCRFVFPSSTIVKHVLTIGIHLARGVKLALAPAVLASIYRDLSLLKDKMVDSKDYDHNHETAATVCAPFQFVQIWIWERFPKLRPNPSYSCMPRFAKWDKKSPVKDVSSFVGSALEEFCWQPYGEDIIDHSVLSKVYQDVGKWVNVDVCLDEGLESWARCLRVSELVGMDGNCMEQYLPHRVAMQFGMNQDVPGDVVRANETSEIAWKFYSRPVKDAKLYIPSRVSEPHVTARYLEWRNKSTGSCKLLPQLCDDEGINLVEDESRTEGSEDAMGNNDGGGGGYGIYDDNDDADGGDDEDDKINALGSKLEARIGKLEEVFQYLKAKKQKVI
uniref:serine/threonine-protein phosphatase 7 long form homolog n=1 Tax=Erigeron canadensis TaxID=72917 RepID=UPI001CB8E2DC|nr:serine/threonine-protein phosphatase 7 long form homolog [Erigeron canadensis]